MLSSSNGTAKTTYVSVAIGASPSSRDTARSQHFGFFCVKKLMFWAILFCGRDFTWVDTLIVKAVEYAVLKTHMHCMKILYISQRYVFDTQCLENEFWDDSSLNGHLLWKIIKIFCLSPLLCSKRMNVIAGFSKMGRLPMLWTQQSSSCCRVLTSASTFASPHVTWLLSTGIP
jgi:hypothetical protein